ncbi:MAG: glycosyltransferase family 2 protein [Planctomycetales bacterium]|nr:glycosyltransferase family 2 protein [Planctomycetales bacterium]
MRTSIIVPIYNEVETVPLLVERVCAVMDQLPGPCELILVDDGSQDGSSALLDRCAEADRRLQIVHFRRNYGQTAAMQAGIEQARGETLVMLDGDLQNEPSDIPKMLEQIDAGYDLVHGWRKDRHDALLTRKLPSRLANWLISRVTGFPIHDLGCTLKAMRYEIAEELELYGEMHRFIPILAHWRGARCLEMVTTHHARQFGKTKYGLSRTVRVVLDLLTVKYMLDYYTSPMKLFGRVGLAFFAIGLTMLVGTMAMKLGMGFDMTGNPLLVLGAMLCIVSVQLFSVGLLGEANTRLYYRRNERRPFAIRNVFQSESSTPASTAPATIPMKKPA